VGRFGLLGQDKLEMMRSAGFDGSDYWSGTRILSAKEQARGSIDRGPPARRLKPSWSDCNLFKQRFKRERFSACLLQNVILLLARPGSILHGFEASRAWRSATVPRCVCTFSFQSPHWRQLAQTGFKA